ncbi:hypothetical protein BCV71DRAFT_101359 [Rhizopus microsporus]|uniref:Uncharacterized protein n=1 Tax=Rhizopus microsporus TaxID=58291 RepID=A0A1X0S5M3_RHIZD|nr:hypothetical protein BCV71DRAFT_101359 [Rhizopus microsporus]
MTICVCVYIYTRKGDVRLLLLLLPEHKYGIYFQFYYKFNVIYYVVSGLNSIFSFQCIHTLNVKCKGTL